VQVNNRLTEILAEDRFITAFVGLLEPQTHRLRFHSAGQGPIFFYRAAAHACERFKPTSFPLGAMPLTSLRAPVALEMQPGDILVLLSDGFYECEDPRGEPFGEARVQALVAAHHDKTMAEWLKILFESVTQFMDGAPQGDDMTAVVVKRERAE
jgi:phosphoserine phosphatase